MYKWCTNILNEERAFSYLNSENHAILGRKHLWL